MSDRVVIGYIHPGEVRGEFMDSVLRTVLRDAGRKEGRRITTEGGGYLALSSGPRISSARNSIVRQFLDSPVLDADWLWMLDADMSFEPDTLDRLMEVADAKERPIIGGLCFGGGRGRIFPTMYELIDPSENDGEAIRYVTEWPEGAVVEVDATGAACLLMHRSVLEQMRERFPEPVPWFAESIYKGTEFGEDWTFCLRVRRLGHRIYVNTNAPIGHVKTVSLDEELWRTGKVALGVGAAVPKERKAEARVVNPLRVVGSQPMNRQQRREAERKKAIS